MSADDPKPVRLEGRIETQQRSKGSKSERTAFVLMSSKGNFLLQWENGNPFHDERIAAFAGKTVHVEGLLLDDLVIVRSISEK